MDASRVDVSRRDVSGEIGTLGHRITRGFDGRMNEWMDDSCCYRAFSVANASTHRGDYH